MGAQTKPGRSPARTLAELATEADCTTQACYQARERDELGGVIQVGRSWKMRPEAFEYHRRFGWGRTVPKWGTAAAVAYEREADRVETERLVELAAERRAGPAAA